MRNVHAWLEVGSNYTTWVQRRSAEYGFEENTDFILAVSNIKSEIFNNLPIESKEYHATFELDQSKKVLHY